MNENCCIIHLFKGDVISHLEMACKIAKEENIHTIVYGCCPQRKVVLYDSKSPHVDLLKKEGGNNGS